MAGGGLKERDLTRNEYYVVQHSPTVLYNIDNDDDNDDQLKHLQ